MKGACIAIGFALGTIVCCGSSLICFGLGLMAGENMEKSRYKRYNGYYKPSYKPEFTKEDEVEV